jgi:hypothetical protein
MMLALYEDLIPRFCPCCGTEAKPDAGEFVGGVTMVCLECGLLYAFAAREHILAAADAAGTDLRRQWERERA